MEGAAYTILIAMAPAPPPLVDATQEIQIDSSIEEASAFHIRFGITKSEIGDWSILDLDPFRPFVPVQIRIQRGVGPPEAVINGLRLIQRKTPKQLQLHLIVDNYGTHTHPDVQAWLAKHPRFVMHFTPTSASWLNMVERFFRDLTENRLRRGVFRSVEDLITPIFDYIDHHNDNPKPFIWTAKAADLLEKVKRARTALHNRQSA